MISTADSSASRVLPACRASSSRRRPLIAALVVGLAIASAASGANTGDPVGTRLCPAAPDTRKVVVIDRVEIRAPASTEETAAAMAMLASDDRDDRLQAALSLALAGDLPAFNHVLAAGDVANLSTYCRFYINPDGSLCVADEIEDAVLSYIDDPALRPALTGFFEKNLYQRRELFDRLIRIGFDDGRPQDFNRVVMALLATRLDGLEDEVLAQAKRYLVHDTPVRKRVLPGVHRRWVSYFGEKAYTPAISYMEALLFAEAYDTTNDVFVSEFSQTRSRVYLTLDKLQSPEVADVFVRQLAWVVDECPQEYILYELAAFGRSAVRHAVTDEQRLLIAEQLAALLGLQPESHPTPTRGGTDYRTHKIIVELLAELGTAESAAVLVKDLRRLTEIEDRRLADSLIVSTLEVLRQLPESTELDVPAFLEASAGLDERYRLHNVPTILDQHPDPAAHAFYLDQLRWVVDNWEGFRTRFLVDPEKALGFVIKRLLVFEDPKELAMTRDAVDRLYQDGKLDEGQYIQTSTRLNEMLGDKSAVFREMEERQRIARETEIQEGREEEAAQWRLVVDENTSPEGIRNNLRSLDRGGSASKRASSWLVIAWDETLPPAHQMLADPDVSGEAKFRLLQVLAEIGDPRSIRPVIDFTRTHAENRAILGNGLRTLTLMPTSAATFEFAEELLGESGSPLMRQQALVYLAAVRDRRGAAFSREYSAADIEPEVRVAGLFLAARLGDRQDLPVIVELLETTEDRSNREVLLRALAELSTPESLNAFAETSPSYGGAASFRDIRQLVEFRHAEGDRKLEMARRVIEKGHPWDRREAVRFLVEERHTEVLFGYLQLYPSAGLPLLKTVVYSPGGVPIFAQIRRLGYRVEETPDGLVLVRDE